MKRAAEAGIAYTNGSFEALVVRYGRRLHLYALQMLGNHEDAEEAVQDAFVRAYRAWGRVDVNQCHDARLKAWLFKITLNVVRNRFRKKQLTQVSLDGLSDPASSYPVLEDHWSPEAVLEENTKVALIENAICRLPSHLLEAARLRFIDDLTHSQIALQRSQPLGTVKSQVSRARRLLHKLLESDLGKSA